MTLKNSFLTNMFENFKRRTWLFALSCLFFFFYYPVLVLIYLQNITTAYEYDPLSAFERIQSFMMQLTSFSPLSLFIVTVAAFICATQGYSYLHNRKKIDFYHCLPVTKAKRFFTIYLNGILAFFLPYILGLSAALLIFSFSPKVMTPALLWNAVYGLLFNLFAFLAIYNLVIIAITLTGRGIIAFLGFCVLTLYEFLGKALIFLFCQEFFQTFNYFNDEMLTKNITSPLIYIASKLDSIDPSLTDLTQNWSAMASLIPRLLFYILVYGAIGYFLYCKRPSEGGGKAIAFPIAKPIIKVLMVVPCSLFTAVLFRELTNENFIFMIFGMIIGLLLSHGILEVIFEFDLRAAFHHGKQLLLSFGIVVVVYCVFQFDLIRYDNYLPDTKQLENAAILVYSNDNFYDLSEDDFTSINWRDYQSERMQLTDLSLIEEMVANSVEFTNGDYDTVENSMNLNVTYRLKNGKEKYRSYTIDLGKHIDLLDRLYTSEEFKTSIYQIFDDTVFSPETMKNFDAEFNNGYQDFSLSPAQASELLDIYKKELLNLTCTKQYFEIPVGSFDISRSYDYNYLEWSYPIYSSFTETIQYLKDQQLYRSPALDPQNILSIELINYNFRSDNNTDDNVNQTKVYTNPEEIAQIAKALCPSSLVYLSNTRADLTYTDFAIKVKYKDSSAADKMDDTENYDGFHLLKKDTPEFVLTDMKYEN